MKIAELEDFEYTPKEPRIFPYSVIVHKPDPVVEYYETYRNIGRKYTRISQGDLLSLRMTAAFNALNATRTRKETVAVKGDNMIADQRINLPSRITYDISEACIRLADGVNAGLISNIDPIGGNSQIDVIGGILDGNRAGQVGGANNCTLRFDNVTEFLLDHVRAQEAYIENFAVIRCSRGEFRSCIGDHSRDDGLSILQSHKIVVLGGEYMNAAGLTNSNGIEIEDGSYDISLIAPRCHHNKQGIQAYSDDSKAAVHDITMDNPICYENTENGILLESITASLGETHHVSIKNPNCRLNTLAGICASGAAALWVKDVQIDGGFSKDNGSYGVRCSYHIKNLHVKGTDLLGNTLGPFYRNQSIDCFVGQPDVYLWSMYMSLGTKAAQVLGTAGRVYLTPIQLEEGSVLSQLCLAINSVSAGNVILGIYGDAGTSTRKPDGEAVIGQTVSTASPGTYRPLEIAPTIGDIYLPPGLYWLGVESDTTTLECLKSDITGIKTMGKIPTRYFNNSIGYGVLDDPCPVTTIDVGVPDYMWIRTVI